MSKSKLFLKTKIAISAFLILSFLVTPLFNVANADPPQAPKTNHLPQISVPAPGGVKVNTWNGNLFFPVQLLSIPGRGISIDLGLSYNSSWYQQKFNFGYGWQLSYNMLYEVKGNGDVVIVWEDGRSQTFKNDNGNLITPPDNYDILSQYESGKYRLTSKSGLKYFFDDSNHKKLTKIQETNGNSLTFAYNGDKQLTKVTDSSAREVNLSYTSGKLTSISDANTSPTRTITLEYDTNDNLTKITDPLNKSINLEYNSEHFLTKVKDKKNNAATISYSTGIVANVTHDSGASIYFAYNKETKMTSVINSGDTDVHGLSRYYYDTEGRIQKFERVKDGAGNVIKQEFTWDANNNLLTFKDELNRTTTYTYDSKGNILTITDPLSHVTTYTYESTFNKVASVKDANNRTTSYQYDTKGNLLKTIDPYNKETNFTYGTNGDLLTAVNAKSKTTSYTYNGNGYQTATTDPLNHTVGAGYDNAGRALSTTDANNNALTFEYDLNGNKTKVTDALNHYETYAYDNNGNLATKTDANGKVTTYEYDKLGRLVKETNAESESTSYIYDKLGNLKSVIDAKGMVTAYEYDYLSRLIKEIDPTGKATNYEYDAVGNLTKKTDPNGNVINYGYDNANRLTVVDYPGTNDTSYTYDNVGNILTESNADATVTRTFDHLNRVLSLATTTNGFTKTVSYTYDDVGNRVTMTDPDSGVTNYVYDDANRLSTITNPASQVTTYTYDNAGRLTNKRLGNNSYIAYTYDNANRVTNVAHKKNDNSTTGSYAYTYDNAGNKLTSVENGNQTTTYSYDDVYRLLSADYPGAAFENFTYDLAGNRLTLQNESGTTTSTYDGVNKLLTSASDTYTYDNNGNLLTETLGEDASYEYNASNNLKKITFADTTTNEYKYYPDGRRLSAKNKAGAVTYFFYDGANDLIETNNSGTTQVRYTSNGIDEWLGMQTGGNSYYYQLDGQGSVTRVLDSSENVSRTYSYKAFGLASSSGGVANPFTYTGRRADSESNQYYYRARYYDAQNGRFTQKDPSGFVDGTNVYSYVNSNPLNYVDPTGNFIYTTLNLITHVAANLVTDAKPAFEAGNTIKANIGTGHNDDNDAFRHAEWHRQIAANAGDPLSGAVESVVYGATYEAVNNYIFYYAKERKLQPRPELMMDLHNNWQGMLAGLLGTEVDKTKLKVLGPDPIQNYQNGQPYLDESNEAKALKKRSQGNVQSGKKFGATSGIYAQLAIGPNGQQTVYLLFPNGQNIPISGGGTNPDAWTITTFGDKNLNHAVGSINDYTSNDIRFDWGTGGAPGTGSDNFGVRFEKRIFFDKSGDWKFRIKSDDGFRVFVDNEPVPGGNEWYVGWHDVAPTKNLSAGYHNVRLEYFDEGSTAKVEMTIEKDYTLDEGVWLCRITGNYQSHPSQCVKFRSDAKSLGEAGLGNDDAEAINIVGDWQAVLFRDDNFSGTSQIFTGSVDDLDGTTIGRNQASSLRVKKNNPALVTLYDLGDFNGGQFKTDRILTDLGQWGFNDTAESIRVASGYQAIVCSDSDFRGECGRTTVDKASIADLNAGLRTGSMQGTASSVRVCEGTCPAAPTSPTNVIPSNNVIFATGSTVTMQWFGNGVDYDIELSGGALSQPVRRGGSNLTYWTRNDLAPSANPYYWRVKSWNEFGEGSWSQTWNFKVQDITLTDATITGDTTGTVETQYTFNAGFNPGNATLPITYTWNPKPLSGQGTASATYKFYDFGANEISVTVANPSSTVTDTHTININCETGDYGAEYFLNNNLQGEPAFKECEDQVSHNWITEGPVDLAQPDLTIAQNTTHIANYVKSKVTTTAASAQNTVTVASSSGFAVNDEVLVIQMSGTNAGKYEYQRVASIASNTLTLRANLINTYTIDTNGKAQVIKVEKYDQVDVNGTLTIDAWNGEVGGILALKANNLNVSSTGTVELTGKGFRGGKVYRNEEGSDDSVTGQSGESQAGNSIAWIHTWGGEGPSPAGSVNGGGGAGGSGRRGPDTGGGGGGGSYGTAGGNGVTWSSASGGTAGGVYGTVLVDELYLGSGGGAGGRAKDPPNAGNCDGGNGGGAFIAEVSGTITLNGLIKSNGTSGLGNNAQCGGGGGGAGGSVRLKSKSFTSNSAIQVSGGGGGWGNGGQSGDGGTGGLGRVMSYTCNSLTGSVTTTPNTSVSCAKDNFSARWTKTENFTAGNYIFSTDSDDGVKVWVDSTLVIDDWNTGVNENAEEVELTEGNHTIKVEYFEGTGNANILFSVSPSTNEAPVVSDISDQMIGINDTFTTFDLDNFVTDANSDPITWEITGNTNLQVSKDSNNVVTVTKPQGWFGEETVTFKAKDIWNRFDTDTAKFKVTECGLNEYKGEYYLNNSVSGDPEYTICESNLNHDFGYNGPVVGPNLSDLNVAASTTYTANPTKSKVAAAANSGQANVTLSSASGFAANDEVLVIQMTGTNAGKYEYKYIASINGSVLTLKSNLANTYATNSSSKAQVIKLEKYDQVDVYGTLTTSIWNSDVGGVIAIKANNINVHSGGVIDGNGKGFAGGTGGNIPNGYTDTGHTGGSYTNDAPIDGPSGGNCGGCISPAGTANGGGGLGGRGSRGLDAASGGAGGSYGTQGAAGSNATQGWPNPTGGQPGSTYGVANLSDIFFGSGGGGGGKGNDGVGNTGGNGGGVVILESLNLVNNGTIRSNGSNGITSGGGNVGGGGGGAGGSVFIKTRNITNGANRILVGGGSGSSGNSGGNGNPGGAGGSGRARVEYCGDLTGSIDAGVSSAVISCFGDNFSTRWTRYMDFEGGDYVFDALFDDRIKVWIDETVVIDRWDDSGNYMAIGEVPISDGYHTLKVEFREFGGNALMEIDISQMPDQPPVVDDIPDQQINEGEEFEEIDLSEYVSDGNLSDEITWTYTGNDEITVTIVDDIATIEYPAEWFGDEDITFIATDSSELFDSTEVNFEVLEVNTNFEIHSINPAQGSPAGGTSVTITGNNIVNDGSFRKIITLNNSGTAQTNYQVKIVLNTAELISASKMRADGNDIRIIDLQNTDLAYWLVPNTINTANTEIWVKVPSLIQGNTSIVFKYGNSANTTSQSSVDNTFVDQITDLKASWNLNETSGTNVAEASGNSNTGTATGSTIVDAKYGKGRQFNGTTDYVNVNDSTSLNFGISDFTLEAWVKTTATGNRYIIDKTNTATPNTGYALELYNNHAVLEVNDTVSAEWVEGATAINDGNWHHIVGVRAGTSAKIYVDGVLDGQATVNAGSVSNNVALNIGKYRTSTSYSWSGQIDEVKIYGRALTQEEITNARNNYGFSSSNLANVSLVKKYLATEPTPTIGSELKALTVYFDNLPASNVTVVNPTTVTATTPAHAAATVNVSLTNANLETVTLNNGFVYTTANTTPTLGNIPDQSMLYSQFSKQVDLTSYVTDPDVGDTKTWSVTGNTNVSVSFSGNTATISYPNTWYGEENLTFKVTDSANAFATDAVKVTGGYCADGNFRGQYYNNMTMTGTALAPGCTATIDYNWVGGSPSGVNSDQFSARWEGRFNFNASDYQFTTLSDNAVRVYVDNTLILDKWVSHPPQTDTAVATMTAGYHWIKVEYYENLWDAEIHASWAPYVPCPEVFCAKYFNNLNLSGTPVYTTNVSSVNYDWGSGGPGNGVNNDNFSARYEGNITLSAGYYRFKTYTDDGVRLWVDGNQIINNWTDHGATNDYGYIELTAGVHIIKMEYYDSGGGAIAQLSWKNFNECNATNGQFCRTLFNSTDLSGSTQTYYSTVNSSSFTSDWGGGGPGNGVGNDNFSVRWFGKFTFEAGTYKFHTYSDDGIRVYVDNVLVLDFWTLHGGTTYDVNYTMTAGEHTVRVEYFESGGGAIAEYSHTKL